MAIVLGLNPAWKTQNSAPSAIASTAFSPLANSLIIIDSHTDGTDPSLSPTITDSVGLTWTALGTAQRGIDGGFTMSWWAYTDTARTNMTATVTWGIAATKAIKATTYTGTASVAAVISKASGGSATNNLTVNVTTTNAGCRIRGNALDWQALGLPVSTDDETGYHVGGQISGMIVHKAADTAVAGTNVSLNFDAFGAAAPGWGYKVSEILPAAGGGPSVVTLTPATMTFAAPSVAPTPGPVVVNMTPATMTLIATAVTPVSQPVVVNMTPATMTFTAQSVTPVSQSVIINLSRPTMTLTAQPVTPVPGAVAVNLTPAVLTLTAPPVSAGVGAISVTLTPAQMSITARPVAVVPGAVTTNLAPAALTLVATAVNPVPGAVTVSLVSANVTITARSITATPGPVTINLAPAQFTLTASPLSPGGAGAVALTPATLTLTAQPVVPVPGRVMIDLTPAEINLTASSVSPSGVVGGSVTLTPAQLTFTAMPLSAVPGPVTVTLIPAELTFAAVALTVPSLEPTPGADLMTIAFATVTGVGEYIRSELEATEGGVPTRFALIVPGEIAWDNCDCGQFAQTITNVASSKAFPTPASDQPVQACGHPQAIVSVTVSLVRCIPGLDQNGNSPSVESLLVTARVLEEDRQALRRALNCYLRELYQQMRILNYTIGAAQSVGPQGQCGGIEINYSFGLSNDAMCCG